jgi:hypothetical protein
MERYRRRKAWSAMRRRKETQAVEARARSAGEATRRKISSRRSLVRAGGGRSGSVASGSGRLRRTLDAILGTSPPPAKGGNELRIEELASCAMKGVEFVTCSSGTML